MSAICHSVIDIHILLQNTKSMTYVNKLWYIHTVTFEMTIRNFNRDVKSSFGYWSLAFRGKVLVRYI